MEETMITEPQSLVPEYKRTCFRLGFFFAVMLLLRAFGSVAIQLIYDYVQIADATLLFVLRFVVSTLFLQFAPCFIGAAMLGFFKRDKLKMLYAKPKHFAKAVGNFPAIYGMGMFVNILTIVISYIITANTDLGESFNTANAALTPPNFPSALFLMFVLVVVAPITEEFVFRGVVFHALKPYGNGIAILVSGISFGIFHGNFSQLFYTAVLGICLAYITYATGSIFASTVIHAMVNSISGFILMFMSTDAVQKYVLSGLNESEIPPEDGIVVTIFAIFVITALIIAAVGVILAVIKIKRIKRYKITPVWNEISGGKKALIFISRVPVIISLLLAMDALLFGFIAYGIYSLFS